MSSSMPEANCWENSASKPPMAASSSSSRSSGFNKSDSGVFAGLEDVVEAAVLSAFWVAVGLMGVAGLAEVKPSKAPSRKSSSRSSSTTAAGFFLTSGISVCVVVEVVVWLWLLVKRVELIVIEE
ncbi:MAG: hypothetical protein J3R72DRAFT_453982 [Linnemannia gamsii]|nr:MAG: hypothetical protein J3R72DRAFT_453982 [Linnemannia gamsii]